MRWFKHLTDASDDAFIHSIEARFGLDGYARWWKLCEKIGRQLKPSDTRASLALPWNVWESYLKAKRKQLRSYLVAIQNEGRIIIEENGDVLRIELPKLLKFRDEYLRKSGHLSGQTPDTTPDKLPSKIQRTDTENREQKNQKKKTPAESQKKSARELVEEFAVDDEVRTYARRYGQDADELVDDWRDHFRGNGYLVGGKSPVKDAAATFRRWIRNAKPRTRPLLAATSKSASQPPSEAERLFADMKARGRG